MRIRTRFAVCSVVSLALLSLLLVAPAEAGHRRHRSHFSIHISPFWWGHYYGHYYPYGYYYPSVYPRPALTTRDVGAVDLNVRPKKADVYVDGELAGNAGRFDGFPGYLWLDDGEHQLVLVHEGYATVAKTIEVRAGSLVDLRLTMQSGESRPPEEFFVPRRSTPRDEARPSRDSYGGAERDRASRPEGSRAADVRARSTPLESATLDARVESARLKVEITPEDASVYLDGRFLGTVSDLARLHSGVLIDPGTHTLSAVHPGYQESALDFESVSGEELVLKIDLESE